MGREEKEEEFIKSQIKNYTQQFEKEREQQLIRLISEILLESTFREYYEKCNQVFKVQQSGAE